MWQWRRFENRHERIYVYLNVRGRLMDGIRKQPRKIPARRVMPMTRRNSVVGGSGVADDARAHAAERRQHQQYRK